MVSSQQIVVKWIEYAAAGAVLLLATRVAIGRLRQPADRINLILMSFVTAAIVPLVVAFAKLPSWHLGIVAAAGAENRSFVATSSPRPKSRGVSSSGLESSGAPSPGLESRAPSPGLPERAFASDAGPAISLSAPAPVATLPGRVVIWSWVASGLVAVHGLAIALLIVEWIIGVRWLRRMSAQAVPAGKSVQEVWRYVTEGRGDAVRLLISTEVNTPLTYGCLWPTVVIPESIAKSDSAALRFCLAHEWSHVANGDLRVWQLASLCQFALWFQPLFWKMRRELRVCQDFVADNSAAGTGRDVIEYSELLLQFARQRMGSRVVGAMAFLDRSSQLSRRIKMLLTSPSGLRSSSAVPFYLAAGTMSLVCASLISAIRLDSVQADDKTHPAHTVEAHAVEARPLAAAGPGKARQSKEQPAAAKTEPTEMLHYTGTVVDKDAGKGIPNATVIVRRFEFMSEGTNVLAETRHKTDAEGKYSFEIPPEQIAIPRMSIELHVAHDDYAGQIGFYVLSTIREKEALGERPSFERIELGLSEPITGTVVAPDGKPLGGVKIVGYSKVTPLEFPEPRSTAEAITDSSGKFRLNAVKRGKGVFWVVPTDYAETSREITEKHGDVGEIRLRPGVRASGRVLSAEGKPVAGVPVNILYTGGGSEITGDVNAVGTSVRRSAITDNDGHFAFDPLPTGDYWIAPAELKIDPTIGWDFRIRRYELPGAFLPVNVKIQEGVASAPIEIQALPHVIFNAQFLDSKGNKTSGEDVVVNMNGEMDGQYWFGEGRSNSDGTVSICIPHGMHVRLNMELAPRLRFRRGKGKDLENNVMFVDLGTLNDDVEGFEIIRYRETVVRVNAVDAEGKQVKVFRVAATYPWGSHVYSGSDLIFNRQDDGRYQATQMLPDEDVKFTVTAPGYEPASETVRLGEGESKDLVLMLKKATDSKRE